MVRPLPKGAHWTLDLLQHCGVVPGASIVVVPTGRPADSGFPHHTEDTLVSVSGIKQVEAGPIAWLAAGAPPTYATVDEAFDGRLRYSRVWRDAKQGVHVPANTRIGSLSAIAAPARGLTLFEDEYQGEPRLRMFLDDGHERYNLPVVAKTLREAWRSDGLDAARRLLPGQGKAHVRLGLARAMPDMQGKCFLMVNGVYG
jgi:hypothetical protein